MIVSICGSEEKLPEAEELIKQMRRRKGTISLLGNVISVRLADILSALDNDLELATRVLNFMQLYYGRNHPRTALQCMLVASMASEDVHLKQKLLLSARDISCLILPSVREMTISQSARGRKSNSPSTLLSVTENDLKEAQREARSRASVEKMKKFTHATDVASHSSHSCSRHGAVMPYATLTKNIMPFHLQRQNTCATSRDVFPRIGRDPAMTSKHFHRKSSFSLPRGRRDIISLSSFVRVY